jgi:hypothetical protein
VPVRDSTQAGSPTGRFPVRRRLDAEPIRDTDRRNAAEVDGFLAPP